MPTGYTAKLMEQGEEFDKFVLRCARAFGALIMMRDDPMDSPIPEEFTSNDWYAKRVEEKSKELSRLRAMTSAERIAYGKKVLSDKKDQLEEMEARENIENERLIAMRDKVLAWALPSPDHEGLKKFMIEQLTMSVHDTKYIQGELEKLATTTPLQLYLDAVAEAERQIEYSNEEHKKELEWTAGRNRWIKELRASLNQ